MVSTGRRPARPRGMYQWLHQAPQGRNEARGPDDPLSWFRRHDEYHANGPSK